MDQKDTKQTLIEWLTKDNGELKPVYAKVNKVAQSGMTRWIDFYVIVNDDILRITWHIAELTHYTYDRKNEALKVSGCGMDMCFAVVYDLSYALFGNEYKLQKRDL